MSLNYHKFLLHFLIDYLLDASRPQWAKTQISHELGKSLGWSGSKNIGLVAETTIPYLYTAL